MPAKKSKRRTSESKTSRGRVATLAEQMVSLPAGTCPPVLGSRTRIWKQDPSVAGIKVRTVYLHTDIHEGPSDSQIRISGLPMVSGDVDGDFLFEPSSVDAFDATHTYTVVRLVLTMYQRLLGRKIGWQWNIGDDNDPISVFPHGGEGANAFYSRMARELRFFAFVPLGSPAGSDLVFTCRSLDIVGHEAGHGVLDALKPDWLLAFNPPQTGGLHESFGDLTAIFLILSQLDQVEFIIAETKADLHRKNVLAEIGEQFGTAIGRPTGLRNADNDLKLSEVSSEVHDISKVFTGGVYDVLADAFTAARDSRQENDAIVLYEVGQKMAKLTIQAIVNSPDVRATYSDVANEMIAVADSDPGEYPGYSDLIRKHFGFREVLGSQAVAGPQAMAGLMADRRKCCGTMRLREYEV